MQKNMHLLTYPPTIPQQEEKDVTRNEAENDVNARRQTGTDDMPDVPFNGTNEGLPGAEAPVPDDAMQSWLRGVLHTSMNSNLTEGAMGRIAAVNHARLCFPDAAVGEVLEVADYIDRGWERETTIVGQVDNMPAYLDPDAPE